MSPSPTPGRRFKPEPVEASTTKRVRRFAPEPVETTTTSSRNPPLETGTASPKPVRRSAPQPIETTTKSSGEKTNSGPTTPKTPRRFAPQHIASSTSSTRDRRSQPGSPRSQGSSSIDSPGGKRTRFIPEPIETTATSNRTSKNTSSISRSSYDPASEDGYPAPHLFSYEMMGLIPTTTSDSDTSEEPARRKFAPQLIETAKRSRKAGDLSPAVLPSDKTNISPESNVGKDQPKTPIKSTDGSLLRSLPNRQGNLRAHYNTRHSSRQHSYHVPALESIESSESEEADSLSPTPSQSEGSDTSDEAYKDATRLRESVDDRFSGYLLRLAARAAEKQLRDQAAAAFPNSDVHERVDHYVDRSESESEEDEYDGPMFTNDPTRRDSGDEKWALKEMQRHAERNQTNRRRKSPQFNVEFDGHGAKQDVWAATQVDGAFASTHTKHKNMIGGYQRDPDLKEMRKAASPPMLGRDIEFPRCASPDHARFDVTQGSDFLRKQMCYLTADTEEDKTGLWHLPKTSNPLDHAGSGTGSGTWTAGNTSRSSSPLNAKLNGTPSTTTKPTSGLWGGFCTPSDAKIPELNPGLVTPLATPLATPTLEREDPFSKFSVTGSDSSAPALPSGRGPPGLPSITISTNSSRLKPPQAAYRNGSIPPSPPSSVSGKSPSKGGSGIGFSGALEARFELEATIEREFTDAFVTQVYNYLSLGYPSLARKFDEELSRISRVPIEELREDDMVAKARGHVQLVPGLDEVDHENVMNGAGEDEQNCKRWRALRRYVKEWGRQTLRKEAEEGGKRAGEGGGRNPALDPMRAWGQPGRRGSWGN